jgi:hypothetical protein
MATSAKRHAAQSGKMLVTLPWRVVGRVGAIGRDPALFAMRSKSKHDRHSRERQRPLFAWALASPSGEARL